MYSRQVEGQTLTFGVSGKLIRNTLVMYDRETDSLWGQIIGEAVDGPLVGTKLEFLPSIHTSWADWKAQHPDTQVLVKGFSNPTDSYAGYYGSRKAGVIGETYDDDRLQTKEFVVGVAIDDEAVAYPFTALSAVPLVNDTLAGVPIVVVFDRDGAAASVLGRDLDNQTLTFTHLAALTFRDDQTGSTWDALTGLATDGPLQGKQLTAIQSTTAFWFGWKDWHPDTRLETLDE